MGFQLSNDGICSTVVRQRMQALSAPPLVWAPVNSYELHSCEHGSHRREGLAPRCRLFATWGCSMFQGLGYSPIKAERKLGSERREIVRSISGVTKEVITPKKARARLN
ncbi:hypothetical protein K1719_019541 [Acacia pycnantha]|nr:hypothetical protein K1719_019541 [Acacia pycnantha]